MNKDKCEAVIFDSFGVLYNDWSFDLFEELNDREKSKKIRHLMDLRDLDEIEEESYKRAIEETADHSFDSIVDRLQGTPNQKIIDIARKLKERGYKVGLLSNSHHDYLHMLLERDGLETTFDEVLSSSEVQAMKPDEIMYTTMLKRLDVKPENALFIDDREPNVKGAQKLGMESFQFKNNDQLKKDLNQRLEIEL